MHGTCILLIGGAATRMRPLSNDVGKCMIPFLGKPVLHYLLKSLSRHGFTEAVLTSRGRRGEIEKYVGDGKGYGLAVKYHDAGRWSGTVGVVRSIVRQQGAALAEPIVVIYGDSLLDLDYTGLLGAYAAASPDVTIVHHNPRFESFLYEPVDEVRDPEPRTNYGVMEIEPDGGISRFMEKPRLKDIPRLFRNPRANAAVYVMGGDVFDRVPMKEPAQDFSAHLFPRLLESGGTIRGFDVGKGYRLDLGTLSTYMTAQFAALRGLYPFAPEYHELSSGVWAGRATSIDKSATIRPPTLIGDGVQVGRDVHVEGSVIMDGCTIGAGATVTNSVILNEASIGDGASVEGSIIGTGSMITSGAQVPEGTVLGADCLMGGSPLLTGDDEFLGLVSRDLVKREKRP